MFAGLVLACLKEGRLSRIALTRGRKPLALVIRQVLLPSSHLDTLSVKIEESSAGSEQAKTRGGMTKLYAGDGQTGFKALNPKRDLCAWQNIGST